MINDLIPFVMEEAEVLTIAISISEQFIFFKFYRLIIFNDPDIGST